MSRFTPVDFIAPKVKVSIVYDSKSSIEWQEGIIKKVHSRGVNDLGVKYVVCDIVLNDSDSNVNIRDTLYDSDYEEVSDYAWVFAPSFTPLVNQIMKVNEPMETDIQTETDEGSVADSDDTNDSQDSDYEPSSEEDSEDSEDVMFYQKKQTSYVNKLFASLWMLSPWLASLAVVFNAREDIVKYLQNKYC
jgi:hypothetical protein